MQSKLRQRGFSLIEILIVVVILGVLAAVVMPQFASAQEDTIDTTVRAQLQLVRKQIGLNDVLYPETPITIDTPVGDIWSTLEDRNLLLTIPVNPLQQSSVIGAAPGPGIGWVWNLNENNDPASLSLYAVDATGGWYRE